MPPRPRAFGRAGDVPFEFPRTSHAFSVAGFSEVLGFPSGSRLLLQHLRYRSRVAPHSVPPALPAMDRRVASMVASFGGAGCESSRLPLRFAPPVSPTIRSQVAPVPYLRHRLITGPSHLGSRAIRSPRSNLRIAPAAFAWLHRPTGFQVALSPLSFDGADSDCLESPRNALPRLIRICFRRLRLPPHLRLGR